MPTTIRRYADPAAHDTTTTQEEHRQYDEAGNLVRLLGSACCELNEFIYRPETGYALPSRVVQGAVNPTSPDRIQESYSYDLATGLVTHHVDADGRTATFNFDPRTLRLYSQSLPAKPQSQTPSSPFPTPSPPRAMIIYSYNDQALSTTARTAVFNAVGQPLQTASQTVVFRDGRGLTREQRSQAADGSSWTSSRAKYDPLGRLQRQSMPYRSNASGTPVGQIIWASITYDPLGRVTAAEPRYEWRDCDLPDVLQRGAAASGSVSVPRNHRSNGRSCWT